MSGRAAVLPGLALLLPLGVLAAVLGAEMVTVLGTVANMGVAGVLAGMALARLPGAFFRPYGAPRMQAMAQAVATAASIGAGQALMLPIGLPFVLGRAELVGPMLLGAALALLVDGWLMVRLFGSAALPAEAAWPQGAAAAAVVRAGAEGERPGVMVLAGMVLGAVGALYRAPMAGFGVALLGNFWALGVFAAGVLVRAHGGVVLDWLGSGWDLMRAQVPQGMLAGAAVVALGQMVEPGLRRRRAQGDAPVRVGRPLAMAAGGHVVVALVLAVAGGLHAAMPAGMVVLFIAFAAAAALLHALVVGLVAMHAGWPPSLAAALLVLVLGGLMGFPPVALCLLAGHAAATGPGFAAMGQALKTVHDLGGDAAAQRLQARVVFLGFAVAAGVVWQGHGAFFAAEQVAPAGRVFAVTIQAGIAPETAARLAGWALAGAALQLAGGVRRQLGVMLSAGLLLLNPAVGWAVLAGLAVRGLVLRRGGHRRAELELFGAGVIAGDALYALYDGLARVQARR